MNPVFKSISSLCFFVFCAAIAIAQQDTAIYKTIGGNMEDRFRSAVRSGESDLLFAGMTSSVDGFNQWGLVVKTDDLLDIEWTKVYGDNGNASFNNIIKTDNGFLCVGFNLTAANSYDGLVVNFSDEGEVVWEKTFGGADWDFLNDCHLVSDGYVICGETYNETAGGTDGWLLKLNLEGDLIWEKRFGGEDDETFNSIDEFVSGALAIGGDMETDSIQRIWIIKTDSEGNLINENFFGDINDQKNGINAVLTDFINENYYYAGFMYNPLNETQDAVSGALDPDGNVIWVDTAMFIGIQSWNSLEYGGVNELVLTGSSEGTSFGLELNDYLIRRITREQATFVSQTGEGTSGNDICHSGIRINNGFVLSGHTDGLGNGQDDGFIIRTKNSGNSENEAGTSECLIQNLQVLVNLEEVENEPFRISNHQLLLDRPENVFIYDYTGRLIQKFEKVTEIDLTKYNGILILKIGDFKSLVYRSELP